MTFGNLPRKYEVLVLFIISCISERVNERDKEIIKRCYCVYFRIKIGQRIYYLFGSSGAVLPEPVVDCVR